MLTNVLPLTHSTLVPNTADRGSDVGQKSQKLITMEGGGSRGCLALVHYFMVLAVIAGKVYIYILKADTFTAQ